MIVKISGITIDVDEPGLLPRPFRKSLEIFSCSESAPVDADIRITVELGSPETGGVLLSSGVLTVYRGNENTSVFCFTEKPVCALAFSLHNKNGTIYIFENGNFSPAELSEQIRVLLRMAYEEAAAYKESLSLHSSVFVINDRAICFTGQSGAGKSTLTGNYLKASHEGYVLNGDRPVIGIENGVVFAYGAPWSGTEQIYINKKAPLTAIIEVRKHCKNKIFKLRLDEAYSVVLKRASKPVWSASATGCVIKTIEKIVTGVPVYRYYCENSVSAGAFLEKALADEAAVPFIPQGEKVMKVKNGFVLRKALDSTIAVPVGSDSISAQGAIILNEAGAFLWEKLQEETDRQALLEWVLEEFEIDEKTAADDIDAFLESLRKANILDEA